MQAHIKTYGCTLNQADSDLMENVLKEHGFGISESDEDSDVIIVNTCTVKTPTQEKTLNMLKGLEKKGKKVIVTGCMASANRDLIEKYAPSASIVTTSNIEKVANAAKSSERVVFDKYNRQDKLNFFDGTGNVIAKVPVSEGCLSNCSFCETKFARGPLNSFSEELIVNAVALSARRGAKEIQLTSQDMGAYGLDKKTDIARLMERLAAIDGDFKIRVGMLNPEHLHRYLNVFIDALQSDRFYKFVHLPVQSGSDKVLKDMKRMYSVEQFDGYVEKLRAAIPEITIETDIIVGFPTETHNDFEQTLDFVRRTKPNVVNMCRFWSRPHASASKMRQLPNDTIIERSQELGRVVRATQQKLNDSFVGRTYDVLVTEEEEQSINGRLDNYKKVVIKKSADNPKLGSIVKIKIEKASCNVLYGARLAVDMVVV